MLSLPPRSLYEPKQMTQDLQRVCGRWAAGVPARERGKARRHASYGRPPYVHPPLEPICDLSDLCACVGGGRPESRAARTNAAAQGAWPSQAAQATVAVARDRGWRGRAWPSRAAQTNAVARASMAVAGGAGERVRQASATARMSARGPELRRNGWFPSAKIVVSWCLNRRRCFPVRKRFPQFSLSFLVMSVFCLVDK